MFRTELRMKGFMVHIRAPSICTLYLLWNLEYVPRTYLDDQLT